MNDDSGGCNITIPHSITFSLKYTEIHLVATEKKNLIIHQQVYIFISLSKHTLIFITATDSFENMTRQLWFEP